MCYFSGKALDTFQISFQIQIHFSSHFIDEGTNEICLFNPRACSLSTVSQISKQKVIPLYYSISDLTAYKVLLLFIISYDPQNKLANEKSGELPFLFL